MHIAHDTLHIRIRISIDIYSVANHSISKFQSIHNYCSKVPIAAKMTESDMILKWKRPNTVEYPKVWYKFMARDLNSDDLVEYRIEDVTQSNAKDVLNHMKTFYIPDEPVGQALGKIPENWSVTF